jgi:hypothetical protein
LRNDANRRHAQQIGGMEKTETNDETEIMAGLAMPTDRTEQKFIESAGEKSREI